MLVVELNIKFWGVRGSIACPGERCARYGGNTSCVEVRAGEHLFILDAGTGLRQLGLELVGEQPLDADILLTHTHMDHIAGIPFFGPFFNPTNRFRLWSGHLADHDDDLIGVLQKFMAAPLFPIPPEVFSAGLEWKDFAAGTVIEPRPGVRIRTAPLNHPNGATGYRIEYAGKSVCYITDTEHRPNERDPVILDLVRDADVMIYDCTYTDEEYPAYQGWGHSTWEEGMRIAEAANVGRLVIFHHDPSHDDAFMDRVARQADTARPGTVVAREGQSLTC